MDINISEILKATKGLLRTADCGRTIKEISTDSRKISGNSLFIPLKGVNHDGHDHIRGALENGAEAALVEKRSGIQDPVLLRTRSNPSIFPLTTVILNGPTDSSSNPGGQKNRFPTGMLY